MGRHQDDQLLFSFCEYFRAERGPEEWHVAEYRHLIGGGIDPALNQAADDEGLAILHLDGRMYTLGVATGYSRSGNRCPEGRIEAADFGFNLQMNFAVAHDDGQHIEARAEFLELHTDLSQAGGHGDCLFATGKEARGATA